MRLWFTTGVIAVLVVTFLIGPGCNGGDDVPENIKNCNDKNNINNNDAVASTTVVDVSPKCAAVLLAVGTTLGAGGVAVTLTPAALCASGFCSAGVTAGSYAALWQSTMPLVAKGSLFATLQSIAASSAIGASSTTTTTTTMALTQLLRHGG